MNKIICDIKDCQEDVKITDNNAERVSELEFYDNIFPGEHYCWIRLGVFNGDFCPKHRKIVMENLIERIKSRYLTPLPKE